MILLALQIALEKIVSCVDYVPADLNALPPPGLQRIPFYLINYAAAFEFISDACYELLKTKRLPPHRQELLRQILTLVEKRRAELKVE